MGPTKVVIGRIATHLVGIVERKWDIPDGDFDDLVQQSEE